MNNNIWKARTEKKFTLEKLSKMSGIGRSTINDLENGKRSPTFLQLECIAEVLEVSICELMESEYLFYHNGEKRLPCRCRFPECGKTNDNL